MPGPEARDKKQMVVIKPADSLELIHGDDNHVLVSFYVSNDFIHTGKIVVPANRLSDPETHQGDEVFYVAKGTISVLITEEKQARKSVSNKRFEIETGQRFFILNPVPRQLDLGRERVIRSSSNYFFHEFQMALDLLVARKVKVKPMLTHHFSLSDAPEAFEMFANKKDNDCVKAVATM